MKRLKSFFLYFLIEVQRYGDHIWRYITGLPTVRRSLITPSIYLGGQYNARRMGTLTRFGITAIVNMRTHSIHKEKIVKNFKILHLPTRDKEAPTLENLNKGVKFIEQEIKKGGKVYIHCMFGEERGASMAIAYLISTGLTYEDAFSLVKKVRTFIRPVSVQVERLKEFEKIIQSKKSEHSEPPLQRT